MPSGLPFALVCCSSGWSHTSRVASNDSVGWSSCEYSRDVYFLVVWPMAQYANVTILTDVALASSRIGIVVHSDPCFAVGS